MYDRFILNTMIKGWFVENNNETEENTIYLYSFQLKLKEGKRV